jgi:hypothetical protein
MNRFYFKSEDQLPNIIQFDQLARDFDLDLVWPNKEERPWHVTFKVGRHGPRPQKISAWPHLLKAYWDRDGGPVQGSDAIAALILRATDYAYGPASVDDDTLIMEEHHAPPVS